MRASIIRQPRYSSRAKGGATRRHAEPGGDGPKDLYRRDLVDYLRGSPAADCYDALINQALCIMSSLDPFCQHARRVPSRYE
jgi:hypothetical protein